MDRRTRRIWVSRTDLFLYATHFGLGKGSQRLWGLKERPTPLPFDLCPMGNLGPNRGTSGGGGSDGSAVWNPREGTRDPFGFREIFGVPLSLEPPKSGCFGVKRLCPEKKKAPTAKYVFLRFVLKTLLTKHGFYTAQVRANETHDRQKQPCG